MAITYTWDCKTVDTYPTKDGKSDVVFNVHYKLKGEDDTTEKNAATTYGVASINTDDLSTFTEFADLKESDVISWVESVLGTEKITAYKAYIDSQIAEKITPTVVTKVIGV